MASLKAQSARTIVTGAAIKVSKEIPEAKFPSVFKIR